MADATNENNLKMSATSSDTPASSTNNPASVAEPKEPVVAIRSSSATIGGTVDGNTTSMTPTVVGHHQGHGQPPMGPEAGFYKLLMNPLMGQMQAVDQSNEVLDELMRKMKADREQTRSRQLSAHIPVMLQGSGQELHQVIKHVENLITYENYDPEQKDLSNLIKATPRDLDKTSELAVVSHSIAAYVSMLDAPHLKHLATKVVTEVTAWITRIFRFPEASAHFHEEEKEGLAKICQLALHKKYPKYGTDGYQALYTRPPVIYISAAAKHNLGQYLCHQLGLPLSCMCTVPCHVGVMDTAALQKLVEDDIGSGKTPVIVVAYAGTPLAGRVDNLNKLQEICQQFNMWLHLEGSSLSMLASSSIPQYLSPATLCNSMTLNVSVWLALPSVPFVTLFRSPDVMLTRVAGLSTFNVRYKLNCLSLWMALMYLGIDRIVARLQYHSHLAKLIHDRVAKIDTTNEIMAFELQGPSVIFRYQMKSEAETVETSTSGDDESKAKTTGDQSEKNRDPYFDTLNIWLAETLKREVPEVHVTAVDIDKIGLCIRFAPLETSYTLNSCTIFETTNDDVEQFLDCLDHHVKILDATVQMRKQFHAIVESQDNLRLVHLPTWAGLGAVQYIPESSLEHLDDLTEGHKNDINRINHQMVNQLKSTDSAFSLGQTESGLYCVRFGLVTMDTDLEELIAVVYTAGKDVEESSKFLESMSDIVKQGIEQAHEDLLKENQDKLLQEGVLRQVPLVGSLINWWSPPPKDPIKGRTFNLASGKIVSTEDTYKSHIQILESVPEFSPKVRDGPLKVNLKLPKGGHDHHQHQSDSPAKPEKEKGQGDDESGTGNRDGEPAAPANSDREPALEDGGVVNASFVDNAPDGAAPETKSHAPVPTISSNLAVVAEQSGAK